MNGETGEKSIYRILIAKRQVHTRGKKLLEITRISRKSALKN